MRSLLSKIGISETDFEYILRAEESLGTQVKALSEAFFFQRLDRMEALAQVAALATEEFHKYVLNLLFWLHTIPLMSVEYEKRGIPEEILYESMTDISYKMRECRQMRGATGLEEDWFFLFTDIRLFGLGRLQYEVAEFQHDQYTKHGICLKKGDRVYSCHIPSSGKLSKELYMASFQRAYEFFKSELTGPVIPIVCCSYLLWPPYLESVFPAQSNIRQFVSEFQLLFSRDYTTFGDCWRIFNRRFEGGSKGLPTDTALRKNFVKYIDAGGNFGYGYGILLYDGVKKDILK